MLLVGTKYHLWFLPFLLGCSLIMELVLHALRDRDARWRWMAVALAILIGAIFAGHRMPEATVEAVKGYRYLLARWALALPSACWAMAFALAIAGGSRIRKIGSTLGWAGLGLACACSVGQLLNGVHSGLRGLCGLGCMLAALSPWRGPLVAPLARLGRRSYGIYLSHVLVVRGIHLITTRLQIESSTWVDLATFALGFAGSLALVILLEKSPRTAWLNG